MTQEMNYPSPTHKALADLVTMVNRLPDSKTVTVVSFQPAPSGNTLAAQLRAVLASGSYIQGSQ
jgi:hypothetical protein